MEALLVWLQLAAERAFWLSVLCFIVINGLAVSVVVTTRSRELVNRWTSRVLAANLLLLGTGIGVPAAALGARLVVRAAAPWVRSTVPAPTPSDAAPAPGDATPPPRTPVRTLLGG
jgi:hypothetical protein